MKGVHPIFWPDGRATNPPIEEIGPSIVFEAAFHVEQGVGARRSRVFGSRLGSIHAEPCRPRDRDLRNAEIGHRAKAQNRIHQKT